MQQSDGLVVAFNPPAIRGLGSTGGFEFYVQSRISTDVAQLTEAVNELMRSLKQEPSLASANTFLRTSVPQYYVEVDEAKAIAKYYGHVVYQ